MNSKNHEEPHTEKSIRIQDIMEFLYDRLFDIHHLGYIFLQQEHPKFLENYRDAIFVKILKESNGIFVWLVFLNHTDITAFRVPETENASLDTVDWFDSVSIKELDEHIRIWKDMESL